MKIHDMIVILLMMTGVCTPKAYSQSSSNQGKSITSEGRIRRSGPNIPGPGEKVINKAPNNAFNPVQITRILFDGHPVEAGRPFPAGDDWLEHVEVEIKNNSPKTLIQGSIRVDFRELGSPDIIWTFDAGRIPEHQLYTASGAKINRNQTQPRLFVRPGEVFTILLASNYASLRPVLEGRTALPNVSACGIDLNAFFFSDGTRWTLGSFATEDPANPGKYIPITRDQFNQAAPNTMGHQ